MELNLRYFSDWKKRSYEKKEFSVWERTSIATQTLNNLTIQICGFFQFCQYIFQNDENILFVPLRYHLQFEQVLLFPQQHYHVFQYSFSFFFQRVGRVGFWVIRSRLKLLDLWAPPLLPHVLSRSLCTLSPSATNTAQETPPIGHSGRGGRICSPAIFILPQDSSTHQKGTWNDSVPVISDPSREVISSAIQTSSIR